jgi:hypothetical protein
VLQGNLGLRVADGARLSDRQARVKGALKVSITRERGTRYLTVTSNVVWAYAFRQASDPVVVHDRLVFWYLTGAHRTAAHRGLWVREYHEYLYDMDCAAADAGFLKPHPAIDPSASPGAGIADGAALYDPKHTMKIQNSCR